MGSFPTPGLIFDCVLEMGTMSGFLSLPGGPKEQCGPGSVDVLEAA